MKGLEPPRLTAPDPKSGVATNYTTSADFIFLKALIPLYDYKDKIFYFKIKLKIQTVYKRYRLAINGPKMKKLSITKLQRVLVPRAGLEPARPYEHRILSPACLPVPPPGHNLSEKRDSNPRPQPWQGCALPAELFSQNNVRMKGLEPPRLTAPDPKSGVATNYTTSALFLSLF
jgi:hypothetical protein